MMCLQLCTFETSLVRMSRAASRWSNTPTFVCLTAFIWSETRCTAMKWPDGVSLPSQTERIMYKGDHAMMDCPMNVVAGKGIHLSEIFVSIKPAWVSTRCDRLFIILVSSYFSLWASTSAGQIRVSTHCNRLLTIFVTPQFSLWTSTPAGHHQDGYTTKTSTADTFEYTIP